MHLNVARKSCLDATYLMFFFLVFGTLLLKVFGVSLSMIWHSWRYRPSSHWLELFAPSSGRGSSPPAAASKPMGWMSLLLPRDANHVLSGVTYANYLA